MYTRRYPTPPSHLTPPPDYSGTAMRQRQEEEEVLIPPPPATPEAEEVAEEIIAVSASPKEERDAEAFLKKDYKKVRTAKRSRGLCSVKKEGKCEKKREGSPSFSLSALASDDLLLLGLLFLLLSVDPHSVRAQGDVILLLGFLFFIGMG